MVSAFSCWAHAKLCAMAFNDSLTRCVDAIRWFDAHIYLHLSGPCFCPWFLRFMLGPLCLGFASVHGFGVFMLHTLTYRSIHKSIHRFHLFMQFVDLGRSLLRGLLLHHIIKSLSTRQLGPAECAKRLNPPPDPLWVGAGRARSIAKSPIQMPNLHIVKP